MTPAPSPGRFALHLRLTKACNADCAYCSSWTGKPKRMRFAEFASAVDWLVSDVLPRMGAGGARSFVSLEYVGGEILTVPERELAQMVGYARARFAELFTDVADGCQSNLVASPARVARLDALFAGRIGTSVDSSSGRRTVGGSAAAYAGLHARAVERVARRRGGPPGAIYVVDAVGLAGLDAEMAAAARAGRGLVLRPVFRGGRAVEAAPMAALVEGFVAAFRSWAMRAPTRVEPFVHLLGARLGARGEGALAAACPFQRNCAGVSLDLEPDGDLYTCLDMADSGQYRLGNALNKSFDWAAWGALAERATRIDPKCAACPWLAACQGGCMSEAVRDTGSPYGRPDLCAVWTALFVEIDAVVAREGAPAVGGWLAGLL